MAHGQHGAVAGRVRHGAPGAKRGHRGRERIAVANGLGTRAVPIVNTALLGAVARLLGLDLGRGGRARRRRLRRVNVTAVPSRSRTVAATEPGPDRRGAARGAPRPPELPRRARRRSADDSHRRLGLAAPAHARARAAVCARRVPPATTCAASAGGRRRRRRRPALAILLETSPFPGVCGRVCPAPCMAPAATARRASTCARERAWRTGEPEGRPPGRHAAPPPAGPGGAGSVAVVGSARPASRPSTSSRDRAPRRSLRGGRRARRRAPHRHPGVPAAARRARARGRARTGRTAEVHTGRRVDRRLLEQLAGGTAPSSSPRACRHRGLWPGRRPASAVGQGLDFLAAAHETRADSRGEAVVVAGGGTTASTPPARRCAWAPGGARGVSSHSRQMPAIEEEVAEALDEGVMLRSFEAGRPAPGRGARAADLSADAARRARRARAGLVRSRCAGNDGLTSTLPCDRLLLALGQGATSPSCRRARGRCGRPLVLGATAPIYVGGDFAGGDGTVAAAPSAAAAARRSHAHHGAAARRSGTAGCRRSLAGPDIVSPSTGSPRRPRPGAARVCPGSAAAQLRRGPPRLRGRQDARSRARRGRPLPRSAASATAATTCVAYCPEGVLRRGRTRASEVDYDYCKGCGLCAAECPRGVVFMEAV